MSFDSSSGAAPARISAASIRRVSFRRHPGGGIDEREVRQLLAALADDLDAGEAERVRLRDKVSRLTDQLVARSAPRVVPETVDLLSRAQLIANETIAEAERYSLALVEEAREHCDEIFRSAEQTRTTATTPSGSNGALPGDPAGDGSVPRSQLQYLRTYAKVAETQLRAVLHALTAEVDKLGALPDPPESTAAPAARAAAESPKTPASWDPPEVSSLHAVPALDGEQQSLPSPRSIAEISWDPRVSRD